MRVTFDRQANAAYIYLTDIGAGEAERQELVAERHTRGMVVLDFDKKGRHRDRGLGCDRCTAAGVPRSCGTDLAAVSLVVSLAPPSHGRDSARRYLGAHAKRASAVSKRQRVTRKGLARERAMTASDDLAGVGGLARHPPGRWRDDGMIGWDGDPCGAWSGPSFFARSLRL